MYIDHLKIKQYKNLTKSVITIEQGIYNDKLYNKDK